MENATQATRHIAVATNFGEDVLLLVNLYGHEELSRLFSYELEMMSVNDNLDPSQIVGHNVTVRVDQSDSEIRYFNGYVREFRHAGWADRATTYRAVVVPWLWFLTQTADCRIFQEKSTVEIVESIFADLNFTDFQWKLSASYPKREYCVQYRETDFNFVSRLLEEEGIFYYFEHENGKHTLILGDSPTAYFDLADNQVEHPDPHHTTGNQDQIKSWEHRYAYRSGAFAHTDFNFKHPTNNLMSKMQTKVPYQNNKAFEIYDYHGRHENTTRGEQLAKVRIEEIEASHDIATGVSTYRSFSPGGKFGFQHHRSSGELGKGYVITKVETIASAAGAYFPDQAAAAASAEFENRFTCIPDTTPFRPERITPVPVVEGPQTAVIAGPGSENDQGIHVDEFGRVKVQFHWDREGKRDENSSCWMRVSQVHAGNRWGHIDIPRVDEEVIVSFIEGDPDRPIITGRVYNGKNRVPYDLGEENNATNKTRRGNATKTYKGGGYNEMTMDDTKGKEQLRVNAQYDMNTNVNHDQTLDVGNDRTTQIGNDDTLTVANDETATIGNNRTQSVGVDHSESVGANHSQSVGANHDQSVAANQSVLVGANQSNTVAANQTESVGANKTISVGSQRTVSVGMITMHNTGLVEMRNAGLVENINAGVMTIISAGVELQLIGPGGEIIIGPAGIHIKGKVVTIEGGVVNINP